MKRMIALLPALLILLGCGGVKMEDIKSAQGKVKDLIESGAPDSLTTPAEASLMDAEDAKNKGNSKQVKFSYNKAMDLINRAIALNETASTEVKPELEATLVSYKKISESLTGLHKEAADKELAKFEELINSGHYMKAKGLTQKLAKDLDTLKAEEEQAAKIMKNIYGTWVYADTMKNVEHPDINAISKKTFRFLKNGNASFHYSMKGQDAPNQKQFKEYKSTGTFALKGGRVMLSIDNFDLRKEETYKKDLTIPNGKWAKDIYTKPSKTKVTDGSQDVAISFKTLQYDFKKN